MESHRAIYCVETVWFSGTGKASARPLLELLESLYGTKYVIRDAVTKDELNYHLHQWVSKPSKGDYEFGDYTILYLGYHGDAGEIWLNEDRKLRVSLSTIADELAQGDFDLKDSVVHFATCLSIDVGRRALRDFLSRTGALAVSGYREEVDFGESLAFEIIYLSQLIGIPTQKLTKVQLQRCMDTLRTRPYAELCEYLGFNMVIAE